MARRLADGSEARFAAYVEELARVIGHADRVAPLQAYCTGLLLPCERKSVEPMAAVTAPARVSAQHQSMLHFISRGGCWAAAPIQGWRRKRSQLAGLSSTTRAAWTNSVRKYLLPRLEILPRIVRSPVEICFGTRPSQAPKSRPLENTSPAPMAVTVALEMMGPMPGTVINRSQAGSF